MVFVSFLHPNGMIYSIFQYIPCLVTWVMSDMVIGLLTTLLLPIWSRIICHYWHCCYLLLLCWQLFWHFAVLYMQQIVAFSPLSGRFYCHIFAVHLVICFPCSYTPLHILRMQTLTVCDWVISLHRGLAACTGRCSSTSSGLGNVLKSGLDILQSLLPLLSMFLRELPVQCFSPRF